MQATIDVWFTTLLGLKFHSVQTLLLVSINHRSLVVCTVESHLSELVFLLFAFYLYGLMQNRVCIKVRQ